MKTTNTIIFETKHFKLTSEKSQIVSKQISILKWICRLLPSFPQTIKTQHGSYLFTKHQAQGIAESSRRPSPCCNLSLPPPPPFLPNGCSIFSRKSGLKNYVEDRSKMIWQIHLLWLSATLPAQDIIRGWYMCSHRAGGGSRAGGWGWWGRQSQPCWCQSQGSHSEVLRAAGAECEWSRVALLFPH